MQTEDSDLTVQPCMFSSSSLLIPSDVTCTMLTSLCNIGPHVPPIIYNIEKRGYSGVSLLLSFLFLFFFFFFSVLNLISVCFVISLSLLYYRNMSVSMPNKLNTVNVLKFHTPKFLTKWNMQIK